MNPGNYTVEFTPAGLGYVRRILGVQPHDEVRPLIIELEKQCAQQDQARGTVADVPAVPVRRGRGRPPKAEQQHSLPPGVLANGSATPDHHGGPTS